MKYLVHFAVTQQGWAEIVDANSREDAKEKGILSIDQRLANDGFQFFTNHANISVIPAENYKVSNEGRTIKVKI
tara:strand:+ start:699 stop:920 length:222 start_codon:yes stop_codon:yes gene_type:complete